tara:strand:+ start:281 stop:598 length:318 start_codon:yes stop_codon:yes gene_type:complete
MNGQRPFPSEAEEAGGFNYFPAQSFFQRGVSGTEVPNQTKTSMALSTPTDSRRRRLTHLIIEISIARKRIKATRESAIINESGKGVSMLFIDTHHFCILHNIFSI